MNSRISSRTQLLIPTLILLLLSSAHASTTTPTGHNLTQHTTPPREVEILDSSTAAWVNLLHNQKQFGSPGYIYSWDLAGSKTLPKFRFHFEPNTVAPLEVIHSKKDYHNRQL